MDVGVLIAMRLGVVTDDPDDGFTSWATATPGAPDRTTAHTTDTQSDRI
jgi:hypothetical protein